MEGGQIQEQVAQKGYGVSILEDIQTDWTWSWATVEGSGTG